MSEVRLYYTRQEQDDKNMFILAGRLRKMKTGEACKTDRREND